MALYAFDGTWQEGKTGDDPTFTNTNVFRFFETYKKRSGTSDVYVAGIGTRFDAIGRALGGAFGIGELPRLLESYQSLCANWANGDRIIDIVGFSRGAATTLDFCHIIQKRGIRRPGTDDVVEPTPQIRYLGVWDVVASFGLGNLGNEVLNIGHHLHLPKANLQYCFHAMALDERRPSFINTRLPGACEVWFRGVHSDVGGGNGNRPLNDAALRWMMSKGKAAGLPFEDADIPQPVTAALQPNTSHKLPLKTRLISAVDRCHYTVAPLPDWENPPDTCPRETAADEQTAAEVGRLRVGDPVRRRAPARVGTVGNGARCGKGQRRLPRRRARHAADVVRGPDRARDRRRQAAARPSGGGAPDHYRRGRGPAARVPQDRTLLHQRGALCDAPCVSADRLDRLPRRM
jgi:hypothetical protein